MKLLTTNYKLQTTNRGVSLYLALMIMFILIAIGLGVSLIIVSQMKMIKGMGDSVVAFYAADTGIEHSLYEKRVKGSITGEIPDAPLGEAKYKVTKISGENIWQSVGTFKGVKRAIEISYPPPPTLSLSLSDPTEDGYIELEVGEYLRGNTGTVIYMLRAVPPWNITDRGYIEWDISSIPDTATITNVTFQYHGKTNGRDCHIHAMAYRPSIVSNVTVFADCADGTVYADVAGFPVVGTGQSIDLGATAVSDLQAALSVNWFAIGIQLDSEATTAYSEIYSEEYGSANPKPTLYIEYTP